MQHFTKIIFVACFLLCQNVASRAVQVLTEVESGKIVESYRWLEDEKHLRLTLKKDIPNHWFLLGLRDVKGKTLTVDIATQNTIHGSYPWRGVQPVMADQVDTSDPLLYDEAAYQARNGRLPWRRIENTKYDEKARLLTLTLTFDRDEATIAFKYPAPISYIQRRLQQMQAQNLDFEILNAGHSVDKRPLQVLAVPKFRENRPRWKEKPVVLIYAGEHATEHDTPHATIGALQWLLSDSDESKALRDSCNVLLISHLSPDDTFNSVFGRISDGFMGDTYPTDTENLVWAAFWNQWIEKGYPLDVSISIHNVGGAESPNFFSPLFQGYVQSPDYVFSQKLQNSVVNRVSQLGMQIDPKMGAAGNFSMRMMGWQGFSYATRGAFYEINSQYPPRRLSLADLHSLGVAILRGACDFITQPDNLRQQRNAQQQRLNARAQRKQTILNDYIFDMEPGTTTKDVEDRSDFVFNLMW